MLFGGIMKHSEKEARKCVQNHGLTWDKHGEILRQCSICEAYVSVYNFSSEHNRRFACVCHACIDHIPDDADYNDCEDCIDCEHNNYCNSETI